MRQGRFGVAGLPAICLLLALSVLGIAGLGPGPARAQSYGAELGFLSLPVETVTVNISNPRAEKAYNDRVTDGFRKFLAVYPGDVFNENVAGFAIARVRRNPDIADVTYSFALGRAGGLDVTFTITLAENGKTFEGRGYLLTNDKADLPILYDKDGTYVRSKLEALSLYYGNNNAWYGQPDAMLAGNPIVQGKPAGAGYSNWAEGFVHYGLYGITPLSSKVYAYGGLSAISSGSTGQELFTNQTRGYTFFEDAYAGIVGGTTDDKGNRLVFNLSAGRQKFTLANAFLIANTASNGWDRAALQANARWAADMLVLGQVAYNNTKFEAFYVKPDELPVIDTHTELAGINVETRPVSGLMAAASYVTALKSDYTYYKPNGTVLGTREGINVYDARATYMPKPANQPGPFFGVEAALQTHRDINMLATAGYGEVGYSFVDLPWAPSISYRLSYFSGDNPDTSAYERWDPLLSGGNGEQWVQGASHFKVVQDSNVIASRIQMKFRPYPTVEVVPQLWAFSADSLNNIGGNPALTVLADHQLGYEANVTVKWFPSRNWYVHGMLAYTLPGEAAEKALNNNARNWFAAMLFVRYSL